MNVLPYIEVFNLMDFRVFHSTSTRKNQTILEHRRADSTVHTSQRFLLGRNNRKFDPCKKVFEIFAIKPISWFILVCASRLPDRKGGKVKLG